MHQDILGNDLLVGDRIAYVRIGSGSDHGTLAIGRILDLGEKTEEYRPHLVVPTVTVEWDQTLSWRVPHHSTVTKLKNMVRL